MTVHFPASALKRAALLLSVAAALPAASLAQDAPPASPAPGLTPVVSTAGAAQINLTPRRVVFDRNRRTDAVYVFNQGNAAVTVDVALVDNVMLPSGDIVPVSRAGEKGEAAVAVAARVRSARPLVVAAPSRLILPPGQGRTVRLRTSLPAAADQTEYRTHLTVTTVPARDTGLTAEQAAAVGRGELVLRIQSVFGISIPVIVRNGTQPATASLSAMTYAGGKEPALSLTIGRSGESSLYGNVEVLDGKAVIGVVRGIGIYPEIDGRVATVPLARPLKSGETVKVRFVADDARPGEALASGTFTAN